MLYVIWVSTVPGFVNWMEKIAQESKKSSA